MAKSRSNDFICNNCEFHSHYNYFGRQPSFCKDVILLEDAYVMKDPFSQETNFVILGGHCSICKNIVCCNQKCSIFYSKRFCRSCCTKYLEEFPFMIQQDIQKNEN